MMVADLSAAHTAEKFLYPIGVRNPLQRGHRFRRKADSNPVITDSR